MKTMRNIVSISLLFIRLFLLLGFFAGFYFILEPISIIPPARVARDFLVSARHDKETVAVATVTQPQRSGTRKSPQPELDMANFRNTGVAADSECVKHAFVLTPWSCGNWLISRAEVLLRWVPGRPQKTLKAAEIKIGENVFAVEVASTTISRARGLSGRDGLGENKGMFFIFDGLDSYGFWMKDMKFPIDIIWIKNDRVVGVTENAAPEPGVPLRNLKIYSPPEPVDRVLEVPAGTVKRRGIKVGDKVFYM